MKKIILALIISLPIVYAQTPPKPSTDPKSPSTTTTKAPKEAPEVRERAHSMGGAPNMGAGMGTGTGAGSTQGKKVKK